jgi:tetratricopeptide (TPR) repeat protein
LKHTQAEIQQQLEPLIGLKLSIARRGGSMRIFHFGTIRQVEKGSVGKYALHIQCDWRIESVVGIVTGSDDLGQWAFAERDPLGWTYEDQNNLQDVRLGELFKGYDTKTSSYVNATELLFVESIQATQYGDVYLFLSGGYRLALFPTSSFGESWRFFSHQDDEAKAPHFVVDAGIFPDVSKDDTFLALNPRHGAALLFEKGNVFEAQGDLAGAIDQFTQAIELYPEFAAAYFKRAEIYQSQREPELALADLNEALRLIPLSARDRYEIYCERGSVHIDLGNLDEAILDLTHAISMFPKRGLAYFSRACARDLNDDPLGAIADFSELIRLTPQLAGNYDYRGEVYRQQGDFDLALADFNKAIEIKPSDWEFYCHRGLAWIGKGNIQSTVHDYRQALELFPADGPEDAKREMLDFIAQHTQQP